MIHCVPTTQSQIIFCHKYMVMKYNIKTKNNNLEVKKKNIKKLQRKLKKNSIIVKICENNFSSEKSQVNQN